MKIKYNDVAAQWNQIAIKTFPKLRNFFQEGMYIDHKSISEFERKFANYCETNHAIGVSSLAGCRFSGKRNLGSHGHQL